MGMKVAFVGAGYMAREHIKAYQDIAGVSLAGICNRTREKAEALAQEYGIAHVCDDIDDLYAKTGADLVIIAVYETAMLDSALAAMKHPWALFLEKPPGYTPEIAARIAQAAKNHSAPVMVGLNRRYLSSTRAALDSLNKHDGTRVITIFDQQSLATAKQFNHHPDVIKHWMYANSIHLLDYAIAFGRGEVGEVSVLDPWNPENPQVTRALIRFSSGDSAFYQCLWNGPGPWAVSVATDAIRWDMRPLEKATFQMRGEYKLNESPVHEWDTAFKPGLRLQAEAALAATRGEPSDIPGMDEAIKTMRLIESVYGDIA